VTGSCSAHPMNDRITRRGLAADAVTAAGLHTTARDVPPHDLRPNIFVSSAIAPASDWVVNPNVYDLDRNRKQLAIGQGE